MVNAISSDIASTIERNAIESCLAWADWPGMERGQDDGMVWTLTDVPFPFFNNVFHARLAEPQIDRAIAAAIERVRRRGVPLFWWTGPTTRPRGLGTHLRAHGFVDGFEAAAMAADLHALGEARPVPEGATFHEVVDETMLRDWCGVMTTVNEFPDFAAKAWFDVLAYLGLGKDKLYRHFLGRVDGAPVCSASLFFGAGVAGLSNVATLASYGRRGVASGLVRHAFREARRAGYTVGTLFSSPMAVSLYHRLGFQEFGKGNCYLFPIEE